ncbi:MAG: glycosyltransferase family 2 protein, partial [Candidatus Saccharimonadales bacterium]
MNSPTVAVLVPCYNEATTIKRLILELKRCLPDATPYVCDNNSTDGTALEAREAGAIVISEKLQGKGHAVRRLFSDVDADIYVLIDGDCTYDITAAPKLIKTLTQQQLDMVVGVRRTPADVNPFPPGHQIGNRLLTGFLKLLFGTGFTDILSGYRVFSKRFVKSFPALAIGFETETELS